MPSVAAVSQPGLWTGPIQYRLPEELVAQHPATERAHSRLMVVDRAKGSIEHTRFDAIGRYLAANDLLVLNDTKVIRGRLRGRRSSGGRVEILVLSVGAGATPVMCRSSKALQAGEIIELDGGYTAKVQSSVVAGRATLDFGSARVAEVLARVGEVPLPPYIHRDAAPSELDADRYQTVYARCDGSVAAPTAGLHFTPELLNELRTLGVETEHLTLHVGPGTFTPIREKVSDHRMEAEYCEVPPALVASADKARASAGRVIAVGTTSVRALETAAAGGTLRAFAGWTHAFITPGHRFVAIDALITNFHLPGSTLLCLVMALAGEDLIRHAYEVAVLERYRFYSFGDAMLIL